MQPVSDLTLILPAYNEASSIGTTLAEIFAYFEQRSICGDVIVAADGNDGTREIVAGLAVRYPRLCAIGHPERSGKGKGIREAVAIARGKIIGFADADNKVPIEEYDKIASLIADWPIVIGSRAKAQSAIERPQRLYRRIGSRVFGRFMRHVVGLVDVADTQCGFKFFHRDVAKRLFRLQRIDGYMFDVEILMIAQSLGLPVKEMPIRWRDDGDSRLDLVAGNIRNIIDLFRIRLYTRRLDEVQALHVAAVND